MRVWDFDVSAKKTTTKQKQMFFNFIVAIPSTWKNLLESDVY